MLHIARLDGAPQVANEPSSRQETGHPLAEWVKHVAFPRRESTGVAPASRRPESGACAWRDGKYVAWCMTRLHSSPVHPDEPSSRQETRHPLAEWVRHVAFPRHESTGVAPASR